MERKILITLSFVVADFPEEGLAELVAGMEEGITASVRELLDSRPDIPRELVDQAVEFYGATVTLQRPLLPR